MRAIRHVAIAALAGLALGVVQAPAMAQDDREDVDYTPDVVFNLETGIAEGKLVFFGTSGDIKGKVNPDLRVEPGDVVQINLTNGDGAVHDIAIPDFGAGSEEITGKGSSTAIVFRAGEAGEYAYICTIPGHRAAGMEGKLIVGDVEEVADDMPTIAADPNSVGEPVGNRGPQHVTVDMETVEREAKLADGTTSRSWTFPGAGPVYSRAPGRHGDREPAQP